MYIVDIQNDPVGWTIWIPLRLRPHIIFESDLLVEELGRSLLCIHTCFVFQLSNSPRLSYKPITNVLAKFFTHIGYFMWDSLPQLPFSSFDDSLAYRFGRNQMIIFCQVWNLKRIDIIVFLFWALLIMRIVSRRCEDFRHISTKTELTFSVALKGMRHVELLKQSCCSVIKCFHKNTIYKSNTKIQLSIEVEK